ncbi:hypothetical protein FRC06_002330 [Ceratobasidium sp. 370]|nr:hypothetical protein FRC06_002330 [Ceratobasidium sp. 370]
MRNCIATSRRRACASLGDGRQPIGLAAMPEEVIDMIAKLLVDSDLYALSLVCRKLWRIASTWLWREVQGVHQLFWPMSRSWVISFEPTVEHHGHEVIPTRSELANHMTKAIDINRIHRFHTYGRAVRILYLGESVFPELLRLVLVDRREPLLPNLHSLFIGGGHGCPEWPNNTLMANDVHELLMLFLSPSLRTLSVHCAGIAIDPKRLLELAPNLTDMRLSSAERLIFPPSVPACIPGPDMQARICPKHTKRVPGVYRQQKLGQWVDAMSLSLPLWTGLTTLKLSGNFLCVSNSLQRISTLANLVSLEIKSPHEHTPWATLDNRDGVFPKLNRLILDMAIPSVVKDIFRCPAVSMRLTVFEWNVVRRDNMIDVMRCQEAIFAVTTSSANLRVLRVFDSQFEYHPLWEGDMARNSFTTPSLTEFTTECDMHVFDPTRSLLSTFLALGNSLTYLCLKRLQIPMQLLDMLAQAFPYLSYLRCHIDIRIFSDEDLNARHPERKAKTSRHWLPSVVPFTIVTSPAMKGVILPGVHQNRRGNTVISLAPSTPEGAIARVIPVVKAILAVDGIVPTVQRDVPWSKILVSDVPARPEPDAPVHSEADILASFQQNPSVAELKLTRSPR